MMKDIVTEQLHEIIVQSKIILSAIQVGDMDIVQGAVDERGRLIHELEQYNDKTITDEARQLYQEFESIELKCKQEMDAFKVKLEKELMDSKNEKLKVQRNKNAMDQYHMQSKSMYSGLSIDNKK